MEQLRIEGDHQRLEDAPELGVVGAHRHHRKGGAVGGGVHRRIAVHRHPQRARPLDQLVEGRGDHRERGLGSQLEHLAGDREIGGAARLPPVLDRSVLELGHQLFEHAELVVDPWIDHSPLRLYGADDLAARVEAEGATILVCEADEVKGPVFDLPLVAVGSTRGDPTNVDIEGATAAGIPVLHAPGRNADGVAELTVGLMLAVLRAIPETDRRMRAGEWRQHTGRLLGERTVGIVGFGGIGRTVAQLLRGFGCRILAHDAAGIPDAEAAELGVEVGSLAEVLSESDVVTVHVPLVPGTRNLIGGNELSAMPTDSILVNTARGGIVDEDALLEALQDGHLAGAALDVFGQEPYDGPLLGLDQVVVTAHIGSAAREARDRMELEAVERLLSALRRRGVL